MISNRLAKGDPRLARLFPDTKQDPGFAGATYPGHAAAAKRFDVVVAVHGDREPSGVSGVKWRRLARGMFSVSVTRKDYDALLKSPDVENIYSPQRMRLSMDKSMAALNVPAVHNPPETFFPHTGKGVVIGIIDHGFDLTHPDFLDKDGKTRVAYFFDQTQEGSTDFGKGVEYTASKINDALRRDRAGAFKNLSHTPEPRAHGTHVAGIAAGNGRASAEDGPQYMGAAPEATLICVNVPAGPDGQTTEDSFVADALRYVFAKAAEGMDEGGFLGMFRSKRSWPCVVNLSYSHNEGGHDGDAMVERLIDRLVGEDSGRAVVVAAGNCGNAALHASWRYQGGASIHLEFEIPVVATPPYDVELWYSSRDAITVQLVAPDGSKSAVVEPGNDSDDPIGDTAARIWSSRFVKPSGDARIVVTLNYPVAPGIWTIRLEADAASRGGVLNAWLDSTPVPASRARFLNGVEAHSTIGTPATARYAVSVGSVDHHKNPPTVSDASGRGPTRDGRGKPEVVAPGVNVTSCCAQGGLAEGLAFYVPDSGTSMSAPHLTGVIACMFEEYGALTAAQIQKVLIAVGRGDTYDEAAGHGMIDAYKAVEFVNKYVRTAGQ